MVINCVVEDGNIGKRKKVGKRKENILLTNLKIEI